MPKIKLTNGFVLCPEGVHIFRVYEVEYLEDYEKINVKMVNADGITYVERFNLLLSTGETNDRALNAFSFFAKTCLGKDDVEEIDPQELVNHYIKAEVRHTVSPSNKEDGKTVVFANLGDKVHATGFDKTPNPKALELGKQKPKATVKVTTDNVPDLDQLLGD